MNDTGFQEVPLIRPYDLKSAIFQYMLDAKKDEQWDGRMSVRISTRVHRLTSIVDSNYNIGNKTNTLTSLSYLGCFRIISHIEKSAWNTFIDCNANMDLDELSICDNIGTEQHSTYYDSMYSIRTVGNVWTDTLNKRWSVPDKKNISFHMHNDHRLSKMMDVFTDKMGFSVKEVINLFVIYALQDSDGLKNSLQSEKHLEKIDDIIKYNDSIMSYRINKFNELYSKFK